MIAAVLLLLIVTAATFLIFFLVPRLAGATPEDLASRYVGRTAGAAEVRQMADKLGFTDPLVVQYALLLPWITLAFLYAAGYARLTRAGMLETMNEDYIRTARAKGLPERTVVLKHGLRSTLTPILTIFGLDLGLLLGGAILTESTYSLPGIGKYAVDAVFSNDLPKVLGVTLVGAFFIIFSNLVVDLLYAVIDPR